MSGIVCAIRGGPDSQRAIDYAIKFAEENDIRLYFLYVVNLVYLRSTSTKRLNNIAMEYHRMGEFILLMAQARAASRGVRADNFVRRGNVSEKIVDICKETQAKHLVMGMPCNQESYFVEETLGKFVKTIEAQCNITVKIV